ncbi:hypothetical protein Tco_0581759 [Tanacetum coccineum]
MNEEQRAQIARDEEIARQWDEEERQRAMSEAKSTKKIDWNDPSVIRYHALKMKPKTVAQARRNMIKYLKNQGNYKISDFKGMSYNEIRPIFEKVWDFNQHIEPMEHGSEKMKSPEKIEEQDVDAQKEMKEVVKESGAKRKKSLPRKRRTVKRQKLEEDAEKEELKGFLDIIPREDVAEDVESLSTKYPIVDWKTYMTENFMYYQIFRGDGSSKNDKVLSEMLEYFDRQDVEELYRLVKERFIRFSSVTEEVESVLKESSIRRREKMDNDDKIDIEQSSRNFSVKPLPDVINTDVGAYAQGSVFPVVYPSVYMYITEDPGEWIRLSVTITDLKGKEIDNIGRLRRYRGLALTKDHSRKRSIGVSRWTLNAVFNHMESYNILEDIKRGPYSKKSPIRRKESIKACDQHSRIKKAQELNTMTSANFDVKDNSSETKLQGRLLVSFQDDAKYEHVGQDTRSQGGIDDQD